MACVAMSPMHGSNELHALLCSVVAAAACVRLRAHGAMEEERKTKEKEVDRRHAAGGRDTPAADEDLLLLPWN